LLENEHNSDLVAQLAQEVYSNDLLQLMILNIQKFEFEVSKGTKKKEEVYSVWGGRERGGGEGKGSITQMYFYS
jgi:hypothetical protein